MSRRIGSSCEGTSERSQRLRDCSLKRCNVSVLDKDCVALCCYLGRLSVVKHADVPGSNNIFDRCKFLSKLQLQIAQAEYTASFQGSLLFTYNVAK